MASSFGCAPEEVKTSSPDVVAREGNESRSDAPRPDQRFPRAHRLTARRQFLVVYGTGRQVSCASFTMFGLENDLGHCRLGVTATRRIGGAVARNRAKRVLREVFRRNRIRLDVPMDLVINVRAALLERTTVDVEREFLRCFERLLRSRRAR
jgi:ribonuclease P protein component